jgi:hypothetical protein
MLVAVQCFDRPGCRDYCTREIPMENSSGIHSIEEMDSGQLAALVIDLLHRMMIHYAMWFSETAHQMGTDRAYTLLESASPSIITTCVERLCAFAGIECIGGIPSPLSGMPEHKLQELTSEIAKSWLAADGIWFQAVEREYGMNDAKRCNDTCWAHFSPFEAWSIKRFLGLGDRPGLDGLERALRFRLYARINVQSIIREDDNTLVFRMDDCRVQSARKRKGMPDYPCKSAGLVEYSRFAEAIDPGIKTECIGCPPDPHPEEWFCAWRFYMR